MIRPQSWTRAWLRRLAGLFRKRKQDAEFAAELESHLQMHVEDNLRAGMCPEDARRKAFMKLGGLEQTRELHRDQRGLPFLESLLRNLQIAARTLRKSPGFTAVAVLVMALGIGSTAALFTVVRSVLLKPLPFKEPERLVRLYEHSSDDKAPYNQVAGGIFAEWKKQSHGFSDLAIESEGAEYSLSTAGGQLPEKVIGAECSWNLFPTLGVAPAFGRGFTESDDQLAANGTVILSWGLWKRRFGGDLSVLSRTIRLNAKTYTVIGIMPVWFAYPDRSVQLWTAVYHEEDAQNMEALDSHDYVATGRLKPGVTEEQARTELSIITRRLHDQNLDNPFVSKAANSRPLLQGMVGETKTPLYMLLTATGCLLLIGCLNVASLLVARAAARRKELAIRAALGGGHWCLLGEHLTESFVLSLAGGGVGLVLAYALIQWFVSMRQDINRVEGVHMDVMVVAFVAGLVFLCALFSGMTSSFTMESGQILSSLQESSRTHSAGHGRVRLRKALLSLEVGLTVILLITAGLLLRSYARLRSSDLGCITKNVLTMRLRLPEAEYSQPAQSVNFYATLLERVRALPGLEAAGMARAVPGQGYGGDSGFAVAEHPPVPMGKIQNAIVRWVDAGYFAALGIPFQRGQTFEETRNLDERREVIISESFARQYFPNEDPLGKHLLTIGRKSFKIVGVVGDTRFQIAASGSLWPMMYFPLYAPIYDGRVANSVTLAIRSRHDVIGLALPVQKIVLQLDPELAVSDILTMDQIVGRSTLDASFDAILVLSFAVLSLLLAAVGLFGVLSYIVAQRTSEIGIRLALGAQRGELLRLTLVDGLKPAVGGLLLGLPGAMSAARTIRSLLYGVQPVDAGVFVVVAISLFAVATIACLSPAWRASRVDPITALRYE